MTPNDKYIPVEKAPLEISRPPEFVTQYQLC